MPLGAVQLTGKSRYSYYNNMILLFEYCNIFSLIWIFMRYMNSVTNRNVENINLQTQDMIDLL